MAFFMLFIVLGLPTSKCIDIPGKTTRSLVGTHGIILFIIFVIIMVYVYEIKHYAFRERSQ